MYFQIQNIPTPFLWQKAKKQKLEEFAFSGYALDSLVLVLPITRTVTEDVVTNSAYALANVNVNAPLPINRTVTEDFPPTVSYSLDSSLIVMPVNRTVTEDFPPTASYALDSVLIIMPVNHTINEDFPPTAGYSLQSVVA